jgi:hypothetical protein
MLNITRMTLRLALVRPVPAAVRCGSIVMDVGGASSPEPGEGAPAPPGTPPNL